MTLDISRWPIFSLLEEELMRKISQAWVFGNSGNEAIFVTLDDDVYSLGSNSSGCLGLKEVSSSLEPRKIENLCKKRIVDIAFGSGPHVLSITEDGTMFSWGHNGYCQLGNGCTTQSPVPQQVTANLCNKRIIRVACGSHHSVALTADGEVFAWGQNNCGQVGSGTTTNQPIPRKVMACIGHRRATSIVCGQTSTLALMEGGEVFGWGYNGNGQLGLGNNVNQSNPCRVMELQQVVVVQVVCGAAHAMALTDEGVLYAWGMNSYGQLGIGSKATMVTPHHVPVNSVRFTDIAAIHYSHISAALTQTGHVYMWGHCRGQSITQPLLTNFASLHDPFALFSQCPVSWSKITIVPIRDSNVSDSIAKAFDDQSTSDLKFVIENKPIYVHKAILKIRCEHFRTMFQSEWLETDKDTINVSHYSHSVYRAFLQYLYTDKISVSLDDAIGLLDLANSYCEERLKKLCENIIEHDISSENAAILYAAAIKYSASDLEDFCFRFALSHMTAVTQSEAFSRLDESVMKMLIQKASLSGAFKN